MCCFDRFSFSFLSGPHYRSLKVRMHSTWKPQCHKIGSISVVIMYHYNNISLSFEPFRKYHIFCHNGCQSTDIKSMTLILTPNEMNLFNEAAKLSLGRRVVLNSAFCTCLSAYVGYWIVAGFPLVPFRVIFDSIAALVSFYFWCMTCFSFRSVNTLSFPFNRSSSVQINVKSHVSGKQEIYLILSKF